MHAPDLPLQAGLPTAGHGWAEAQPGEVPGRAGQQQRRRHADRRAARGLAGGAGQGHRGVGEGWAQEAQAASIDGWEFRQTPIGSGTTQAIWTGSPLSFLYAKAISKVLEDLSVLLCLQVRALLCSPSPSFQRRSCALGHFHESKTRS